MYTHIHLHTHTWPVPAKHGKGRSHHTTFFLEFFALAAKVAVVKCSERLWHHVTCPCWCAPGAVLGGVSLFDNTTQCACEDAGRYSWDNIALRFWNPFRNPCIRWETVRLYIVYPLNSTGLADTSRKLKIINSLYTALLVLDWHSGIR